MIVRVLYFASLRDSAGSGTETLDVPETLDITGLWELLRNRHPGLRAVTFHPLVACDMAYAPWDTPLRGVLEVAFLPPLSGG